MTSKRSPLDEVNMIAKIADLQENDYQHTLLVHAMIELLVQKGLITMDELVNQARQMDGQLSRQIQPFDLYDVTPKELPRTEGRHTPAGLTDGSTSITPPIA